MKGSYQFAIGLLLSVLTMSAFAQSLQITSTTPLEGAASVAPNSNISITFDQNIQVPNGASFYAVSDVRGLIAGTISVSGKTLTFNPALDFAAGDLIRVGLTKKILSTGGNALATPRLLQFMVKAGLAPSDPVVYKRFPIPSSAPTYKDAALPLDFDRDGDIDIITTGLWLRNNGTDGFSEETLPITSAFKIEAADFDHDNDLDLLVAGDGITLMINDGAMNFTPHFVANVNYTTSITVADQNGDGLEDILYADQNFGAYTLAWQLNNGDGTFTKLVINDTDLSYHAYPADVDGDQQLDVVAVGQSKIYWYKNTGASYTKNLLYTHTDDSMFFDRLIVSDTDNDRDPDILTSSNGSLYHLTNNGFGTFETRSLTGEAYPNHSLLDAGDMDGDSDLDIISSTGYSIICFVNDGANSFSTQEIDYIAQQINGASVADIDSDGDLDVTYALYYGEIGWLKNTKYSEAVPFDKIHLTDVLPGLTNSATWADYDGDGDQDLLFSGAIGSTYVTRVYRRNNDALEIAKELPALVNAMATWFDFDNDGDPDILVNGATETSDPFNHPQAKIFINTGSDFNEYVLSAPLSGGYLAQAKPADLNNDGKDEIIMGGIEAGVYALDGSVYKKVYSLFPIYQNGRFAIADIDGDDDLDIAATGWLGNDELGALGSVFINQGNFNFEERKKVFNGITSGSLLFTDLDNDSDVDLASVGTHRSSWGNYASSSLYNNKNGQLEFITPGEGMIFVGYGGAAAAADFDNDGYNDLITQHGEGWYQLELFLNDKAGWFKGFDYQMPDVSNNDYFIEPVDFDLDQDVDFMVGNKLIRNNTDIKNVAPTAPVILVDSVSNNFLYMHWSGASDPEAATPSLTYQPFVGTTANSQDVMSAMANLKTGVRYVQRPGIASDGWKIKIENGGEYYWGVQSIDPGLMSSPFARKTVHVIHIDGEIASCRNMIQTYKVTPAGAYTWVVKGGEVKAMSGDEISIEWKSDAGKVMVSDGVHSNSLYVHVVDKPAPAIIGLSEVCASNADGSYSTLNVASHEYRWEINGGNFLRSADTAVAFVKWGTPGAATLKVFETSHDGICTIEAVLPITVRALTTPAITGPTDACVTTIAGYSVTATTGSTWTWDVFGGEIIGSNSSSDIDVKWFDQSIGRVTVQEANAQVCTASGRLEINLHAAPVANIQGFSTVCNDAEDVRYSTEAGPSVTYEWSVEGGSIQGASNAASVFINWVKKGTGKVHLITRAFSCESSDSLYVNFFPAVAQPTITAAGNVLSAPAAASYQWVHDNLLIEGATNQQFIADEPGMYNVLISDEKGCTVLSDGHPYLVTDIGENAVTSAQTYPNPVRDHFFVELNSTYRGPVELTLVDITGRVVSKITFMKDEQMLHERITVEYLKSGFLTLFTKTGTITKQTKIIVE
jgi:hypothetical protein